MPAWSPQNEMTYRGSRARVASASDMMRSMTSFADGRSSITPTT